MSLDRNKTAETHRATATAIAYLDLRGFKPIETEVPVFDSWVADVASYVYPSNTELQKLKVFEKKKKLRFTTIDYDQVEKFHAIHGPGPFTAIVEVKTSKGDYKRDLDFKFAGRVFPAHLCYIACPKKCMKEIPRGWIWLVLNEMCDRLIKVDRSAVCYQLHPQHPGQIVDVIAGVGIRRHHRTQFKEMRDWSKMHRAEQKREQDSYTLRNAMEVLKDYILGDSEEEIDKLIRYYGIRQKLTAKSIREIAEELREHAKGQS